MQKSTRKTNFPVFPLAITSQSRPGLPSSAGSGGNSRGNSKTGLISGRRISGGS